MKRRNNFDQGQINQHQEEKYELPKQMEPLNSVKDFGNGSVS